MKLRDLIIERINTSRVNIGTIMRGIKNFLWLICDLCIERVCLSVRDYYLCVRYFLNFNILFYFIVCCNTSGYIPYMVERPYRILRFEIARYCGILWLNLLHYWRCRYGRRFELQRRFYRISLNCWKEASSFKRMAQCLVWSVSIHIPLRELSVLSAAAGNIMRVCYYVNEPWMAIFSTEYKIYKRDGYIGVWKWSD